MRQQFLLARLDHQYMQTHRDSQPPRRADEAGDVRFGFNLCGASLNTVPSMHFLDHRRRR
jgi:hypothetical protein